jgi:hypothetical protein
VSGERQMSGPAQRVIWIASYPKSGNTWVQSVVRHAGRTFGFPKGDFDVYRLMAEKRTPEVVRGGIQPDVSQEPSTVLKTHARYIPGQEPHRQLHLTTAGFVYVMRNPLDLLLSYINFTRMQYQNNQDSAGYQQALFVDLLGYPRPIPYEEWVGVTLEAIPRANLDHALGRFTELNTAIPSLRNAGGSWLEHCMSWRQAATTTPCAFLKYEELLRGPEHFAPLQRLFTFSDAQIAESVGVINQRQRGQQFKKVFYNKMSSYYYPQFFSAPLIRAFLSRFDRELKDLGYDDLPQAA